MTLFATTGPQTIDAVRVLSAVGDVFGGHAIGYSMRVANVAARFAVYRERSPEAVAACFFAGALHRVGALRGMVPRDAAPRVVEISSWDDPPAGAAIVAAAAVFPPETADIIRWHREAFDGTGFPDQLRWNSIPEGAMAVNLARAFVGILDEQGEARSAPEALFTLVADGGCAFDLADMGEFRDFVSVESDVCDAPYVPHGVQLGGDPQALVAAICSEIDARQERTTGRGDRLERIVRAIVARLRDPRIDPERAVFAGRLTALARTGQDGSADDIFTLSRLGLESRAARAATSARILETAPAFARFAPMVGEIEEWFDGTGLPGRRATEAIDPVARVLAVAIAAEALIAGDAARRIEAAAGTRLDPAVVAAHLGAEVGA